jgi:23S rRNA (cytosine1962-C5)-methyltransferase
MKVILKPDREGPIIAGHPWIFSRAIARVEGKEPPGSVVTVLSSQGRYLGRGYMNPRCSIAVRMLTRREEQIDASFMRGRLQATLALRRVVLPAETGARRLVNGEGDFLPGLVVDVYENFLVCQCLTAGADSLKGLVVEELVGLLSPQGIYEKSEGGVRREEGLINSTGVLWGEEPPGFLQIHESGCVFLVDVRGGQKTGFFLDQRDNRRLVGRVAEGKKILDGFAYTGGFGISAARGGARQVISIESSLAALKLARKNWELNNLAIEKGEWIQADLFRYLREIEEHFDLMVLDPPPFVRRRQDLKAGLRGYKEINLQAFHRLEPAGQLFTFSCSQHLPADLFIKVVLSAAADAGRSVQVLRHLGPAADHPLNLAHPEGEYLKGLWLRVL